MAIKLNNVLFAEEGQAKKALQVTGVVVAAALAAWGIVSIFSEPGLTAPRRFQNAYDAGRLDEALAIARELGPGDGTSLVALQSIAASYLQKALAGGPERASDLSSALEAARAAEKIDPKNGETQRILGYVLDLQGDQGGAERSYLAALSVSPDDSATLSQYAALLAKQGKAEAAKYFDRAVAADGGNPQTRMLYAHFLLARGKPEAAISQAYYAATSTNVAFAVDASRVMATAYARLGDFDDANKAAERGVAVAPDSAVALVALGEAKLARLLGQPGSPFVQTLQDVVALADRAAAANPYSAAAPFLGFKATYALNDKAAAGVYAARAKALLAGDSTITDQQKQGMTLMMDSIASVKLTPVKNK